jgi:hypothetical protein
MVCDIFHPMSPYQKTAFTSTSSEKVVAGIMDDNPEVVLASEADRLLYVLGSSSINTDGRNRPLLAGLSRRRVQGAPGNSVVWENVCLEIDALH